MPESHAWEMFAGVAGVVIFLGTLAFALQRLGIIGRKRAQGTTAAPIQPSPEALALIEATQTLVRATEAIATRSEALGRIHQRIDCVDREIAEVKAQNARLEGKLDQQTQTLGLIQQYLISK